jgi:hypothetical protein
VNLRSWKTIRLPLIGIVLLASAVGVAGQQIRHVQAPSYPSTFEEIRPFEESPKTIADASWVGYPSFEAIIRKADLFVVAEVVGTTPGRKVTDYSGTDVTPFTNVQLRVLDVGKGDARAGQVITIEQYGGLYRPTHAIADTRLPQATVPPAAGPGVQPRPPAAIPDRDVLLELRQDPLLKAGERLAIALTWNNDLKLYQRFAFQARFAIDDAGRVHPVLRDDPIVAGLDGMSVSQLLKVVGRAAMTP